MFLNTERQKSVTWGILKYFLHKWHFALYFILSRDVPILKSFSAGRLKIIDCSPGGCSAVAAVAELWWPIVGKVKIKNRTTEVFFFQCERKKQKVGSKVTQRLFVTNET